MGPGSDLESFRRERIFQIAIELFWIFVCKNSKNTLKWMKHSAILNTICVMFIYFIIYTTKHNPPNNYRISCHK